MSDMIDNNAEAERARRKAFIERIRKENDEAPRPTIGVVELMQARERLRAREAAGVEEEDHHWAGTRASDMTETARADVLTEARRNVGANVEREREGDGELIYKTVVPNRELDASQSTSTQTEDWATWLNAFLDARFEQERKLIWEACGTAIGEMLSEQRAEDRDKLHTEVNRLWQALSTMQELLRALDRTTEHAKILDMPNPLQRRVN